MVCSFKFNLGAIIYSNFVRPSNAKELYNLCHASARNVIERIFGILKWCFHILLLVPEYDMDMQVKVPPALCALHNFIHQHDPSDIEDYANLAEFPHPCVDNPRVGDLMVHALTATEQDRADMMQDQIAQAMWDNYQ